MFWEELGHIVGTSVDNDPARIGIVVFGHLFACQLDGLRVVARMVHVDGIPYFDRELGGRFDVVRLYEQESTLSCRRRKREEVDRSRQEISAGNRCSLPVRNKGIENMLPSGLPHTKRPRCGGNLWFYPRYISFRSLLSNSPQILSCKRWST
jgi:hypothetical protein